MTDIMRKQYRVLTDAEKETLNQLKDKGEEFFNFINNLANTSSGSRELSLAKTKVEEAYKKE